MSFSILCVLCSEREAHYVRDERCLKCKFQRTLGASLRGVSLVWFTLQATTAASGVLHLLFRYIIGIFRAILASPLLLFP